MATLVVQLSTTAGVVKAALVAAAVGGDQFANNGKTHLEIANGSGAPITVTVPRTKACDQGSLHPVTNSVAAGVTDTMGPFPVDLHNDANGMCQITYSGVTTLTIGAFSV